MKVREIITYKTISMISSNANRKRSGIKSLRYFAGFGVAFLLYGRHRYSSEMSVGTDMSTITP